MTKLSPPYSLIMEVTHRCPLQCVYCSNPLELAMAKSELPTSAWQRVLDEAAALGIFQVHFTGGEPLARRDIVDLVAHATKAGLYSNLDTSGVLLTDELLGQLVNAGIDHIQLSFQDVEAEAAERYNGYKGGQEKKLAAAKRIRDAGLPLTVNFVIHRDNCERLPQMLDLGVALGAERIEVAHVQYYGWALLNRDALLPTRAQLAETDRVVAEARARLKGQVVIDYVIPDYYAARPKACMGGWGNRAMLITPTGKALPCHAADSLPGFTFPNVTEESLGAIWADSDLFNRYRGTSWMPEPCQSCARKEIDWGGCRCQAFALTGEAVRTDPVCDLSSDHHIVQELADEAMHSTKHFVPRRMRQKTLA